jgi:hypothetical protein
VLELTADGSDYLVHPGGRGRRAGRGLARRATGARGCGDEADAAGDRGPLAAGLSATGPGDLVAAVGPGGQGGLVASSPGRYSFQYCRSSCKSCGDSKV